MEMLNNERGSIIIESSIIIPFILIVLIGLMTFAFVFHDMYISDLLLQYYIEDNGWQNGNKGTNNLTLNNNLERIQDKLILKDMGITQSVGHIRMDKKIDTMVLGEKTYHTEGYELATFDPIQNVKQIEVLIDAFDYLSISDVIHTKYTMSLDTMMDLLESH